MNPLPIEQYQEVTRKALSQVKARCTDQGRLEAALLDANQLVTSELAFSIAELQCAENYLLYADKQGELEQRLANGFAAEVLHSIRGRLIRAPSDFGLDDDDLARLSLKGCEQYQSVAFLASLGREIVDRGGDLGYRGLDEEKLLMADTFRQFAEDVVKPLAEKIHREDMVIPDEILEGVRALGCFGLSVPQR